MANTPTSYAASTLNQMSPTELENQHMLLEGRIAELNDELARVLESTKHVSFFVKYAICGNRARCPKRRELAMQNSGVAAIHRKISEKPSPFLQW